MSSIPPESPPIPSNQAIAAPAGGARVERLWLLGVFLLATLWASAYLKHAGFFHYTAFAEQADIAEHLARGHGFLSPLDPSPHAPPTTWAGPIYPALMAGVYLLFGIKSPASLAILMAINACLFGAVAAGAFSLGRMMLDRRAGLIAAVLLCAHPVFLRLIGYYWDTYLALAMFTWMAVAAFNLSRRPLGARAAALFGGGMAFVSLTNPAYALGLAVLACMTLHRTRWTGRLMRAALMTVVFLAIMFPWTLRNYRQFGRVFFVRAGLSLELWVGNQPSVPGWGTDTSIHPTGDPGERDLALRFGETRYFALCHERFLTLYRHDPAAYWSRVARRIIYEFQSDPTSPASYPLMDHGPEIDGMLLSYILLHGLVAVGGLAGFWTAWRLGRPVSWQPLAIGLACTAPFLFTHVNDRYCLPLRLMLLLGAAVLLGAVWQRIRSGHWPAAGASPASRNYRPGGALSAVSTGSLK